MRSLWILLAILFTLAACGEADKPAGFSAGEVLELKSYDGKKFSLQRTKTGWIDAEHPQNALLIDVFGTFCPPCKKEAPKIFDLAQMPGVSVLALSYSERASDEKLKNFAQNHNAYYFLSNDARNEAIVAQIAADLAYSQQVLLPFKVLLKDGEYQQIGEEKFLLGLDHKNLLKPTLSALAGSN